MSWWGKIAGGAFGFMLGGPLGALFGAALGHHFDKGLSIDHDVLGGDEHEQVQAAFFAATFSVMGHIAKADGQVTSDEIQIAEQIMAQMSLSPDQRNAAQKLFQAGKTSAFELDEVIQQFRSVCGRRRNLLRMFMEIQFHAAYADGEFHTAEEAILKDLNVKLGFDASYFSQLEALIKAQRFSHQAGAYSSDPRSPAERITNAYQLLGVSKNASDAEVKKAYRRLMSQHHPDKLVAKGLPDEMMRIAKEKTQDIKAAYELIKESRG